jgi:GT2 family glycosyltransferase
MKTTLVIPAYYANNDIVQMTAECIASLYTDIIPDEVIVVDDGSPITAVMPGVTNIHRKKNGGYSKAVNRALFEAKNEIIIVANNDMTFHTGWLKELLMPLKLGYDLSTVWTSDQADFIDLRREITPNAKFGSIFAMKRKVYDTIGGFDERFRGYFTDDDYRNRVLEAGFRIGLNCDSVIQHQAKGTYSVIDRADEEYRSAKELYEELYGYANRYNS